MDLHYFSVTCIAIADGAVARVVHVTACIA
jgi:hypothetical protein